MYSRYLNLNLPQGQSAFLWGARKTGKSTYLKMMYPDSVRFDLLNSSLELKFTKAPWQFREEVLSLPKEKLLHPIIVDEIQKVPAIMDEIHWLIENSEAYFILCGSSVRKMRRRGVNMLGGRAIGYNFFPFVYPEIKDDFDLLLIFNHGLIPSHYTSPIAKRLLQSYINDYLSSEIKAESLTRNLAAFNRFLDSITFSHGEMINYSNIARDVGISADTVKEYYNILEDTLIGYLIYPYSKKASRRIISFVPKFYLFDVGVANRLIRNTINGLQGAEAGRSLEHYIFLELYAYIHLNHLDHAIEYWRTHTGIEVDFIISDGHNPPIPVEVKISSNVHVTDMKGLKIFMSEYGVKMGYMVSMENSIRTIDIDHGKIIIYPVRDFLDHLWSGDLVK